MKVTPTEVQVEFPATPCCGVHIVPGVRIPDGIVAPDLAKRVHLAQAKIDVGLCPSCGRSVHTIAQLQGYEAERALNYQEPMFDGLKLTAPASWDADVALAISKGWLLPQKEAANLSE